MYLKILNIIIYYNCSVIGLYTATNDSISKHWKHILSFGGLKYCKSFWEGSKKLFQKRDPFTFF